MRKTETFDQLPGSTVFPGSTAEGKQAATSGALFVFEGPDGAGKTTLLAEVQRALRAEATQPVAAFAFPGREPGTLGHHIYALHHEPARFGVDSMTLTSLQLLHVAAHVDAIETSVRPSVARGEIALLDRSWWSTWVYGITGGANVDTLRAMVEMERVHWGALRPDAVFLVRRPAALLHEELRGHYVKLSAEYATLAEREMRNTAVVVVDNEGTVKEAARLVLQAIRHVIAPVARL